MAKCTLEGKVSKAMPKGIIGIEFANSTTASDQGVAKIKTAMLRKALTHKGLVKRIQRRRKVGDMKRQAVRRTARGRGEGPWMRPGSWRRPSSSPVCQWP